MRIQAHLTCLLRNLYAGQEAIVRTGPGTMDWFQIGKVKGVSDSLQLHSPWNSPGRNTGVGSLSLLQGVFPNQGSNPGLPHCRRTLYQLSHKESPRKLEWIAYPFYRGSSQQRNQPESPALQADSLLTTMLLLLSHFSRVRLCATP